MDLQAWKRPTTRGGCWKAKYCLNQTNLQMFDKSTEQICATQRPAILQPTLCHFREACQSLWSDVARSLVLRSHGRHMDMGKNRWILEPKTNRTCSPNEMCSRCFLFYFGQRAGNEGLWAFMVFICFYAYATERKLIIEIALLLDIGCSCGRIQGDTCWGVSMSVTLSAVLHMFLGSRLRTAGYLVDWFWMNQSIIK